MKGTWLAVVMLGLVAGSVHATVLVSDDFDAYNSGNLAGQGSWTAYSSIGTRPIQVTSAKQISLVQGSDGEDVYLPLGQEMGAGDKWYAGYTVTVNGPVSASEYFACFRQFLGGVNYFPTKVGVTTSAGSDFTFYIHQGAGSTMAPYTVTWPSGLSYGVPYRLVVSYGYSTGIGELWVNPVLAQGPDGSAKILTQNQAGSSLIEANMYAFRQSVTAGGAQLVDDVIVATTWAEAVPEPASLSLLALGALTLLRRRR